MIANQNDGNIPRVEAATPIIDVSAEGLITATTEQEAGYVPGGSKSATQQLPTQAAETVTPGTTNQTAVASGRYTTGAVQVAGDANLKAENIAEGVSIFGVQGTHSSEVVTGTFIATSLSFGVLYPTRRTTSGYAFATVGMGSSTITDNQIPKYSLVYAVPGEELTISGGITRVDSYNFIAGDENFFYVSGDFTIQR